MPTTPPIQVLVYLRNQQPTWRTITNTPDAFADLVEGPCAQVSLAVYGGPNALAFYGRDARSRHLPNRLLGTTDYLAGTFLVTGPADASGSPTFLDTATAEAVKAWFGPVFYVLE